MTEVNPAAATPSARQFHPPAPRPARDRKGAALFRTSCPVCGAAPLVYAFSLDSHRLMSCGNCSAMLINPQPTDQELAAIYTADYSLLQDDPNGREHFSQIKRMTARHYLDLIRKYRVQHGGTFLEVGCGEGDALIEAAAHGYAVTGLDVSEASCAIARSKLGPDAGITCGTLDEFVPDRKYDVIMLADVLEHVRDPFATLRCLHDLLSPGGTLFIALPSLDSWSARLLRSRWMEFKAEHLTYFNSQNLQTLLLRSGFSELIVCKNRKYLSFKYVKAHFDRYPVPYVNQLLGLINVLAPDSLKARPMPVVASGIVALATRQEVRDSARVSIVVPAYNEAATFGTLIDNLVEKELPGLEREIIVVESNSEDATRDVAQRYAEAGLVKLVLEDRPRGKGHAVRTGLAHATGDIIIIQDADLEYDLDDYDSLLQPIITGRRAFVLGARHGGSKIKLRRFQGQSVLALFLNAGHWIFTAMVDGLFGLWLRDPMTMYKVFRRDCLTGLRFESNRFDFDYELLIKLVRKGYRPIEIPVNYRSRSFKSGKKVSVLRDPWTWLWILLKLRFTRVDPLGEVERTRRERAALAR